VGAYTYDLTPVKDTKFSVVPDPSYIYQISPCTRFLPEKCNAPGCKTEKGYVFGEFENDNPTNPWTLGTFVEFVSVNITEGSSLNTFNLVFSNGKNIPKSCTSVKTTIKFYCSVTEGKGNIVAIKYSSPCDTTFMWASIYGCRKCTTADIVEEQGSCINGFRQIMYTYSVGCHGSLLPAKKVSCEAIEFQRTTVFLGVLVGALLIIIGTALAFYFYQKKRIMEAKYAVLQNEVNLEEEDL